jgi:hypothetical protein
MWKHLHPGQNVYLGDQLRYVDKSVLHTENVFKVVKTEQHYFQIVTDVMDSRKSASYLPTRIVRYFEIGYNVELEVWTDS